MIFRLSVTGTRGGTLRLYLKRYEPSSGALCRNSISRRIKPASMVFPKPTSSAIKQTHPRHLQGLAQWFQLVGLNVNSCPVRGLKRGASVAVTQFQRRVSR